MKRKQINFDSRKTITLLLIGFILPLYSQSDSAYLFTYFKNNGEDGLHIAYSDNGIEWISLNQDQSILQPVVGEDKLMRDPCMIQGPDGSYHMVWTVSWGEKGIGYASTKDLIHWSDQKFIPVMDDEDSALNCWAPEIIYDDNKKRYMIYWSTTIPGKFPKTDNSGDKNYNHRMYYTLTDDFETFSPTKLLYDDGFNVIDGVIVPVDKGYKMIVKDETKYPEAKKNLRITSSKRMNKGYGPALPSFSPSWIEGPTVLKIGKEYIVYYDEYTRHRMGAMKTSDWQTWTDISDQISFPKGLRHGTALTIPKSLLSQLLKQYP
ncbi:glycoside hydrolase family 43 protein [Membranihabitans marinus]|uniref:glycoside hydrolase family 43 protein n=1 Tax=Membranihabitans marinus TaxID=1227546 RepID=UPI001F28D9C7|nr:glycoside hydrolase family 43 protein [Membranihabitans marinus]